MSSQALRCLIVCLLLRLAGAESIKCASGRGGKDLVVPVERINDGYCDCPLDGADEPNTEACSGSINWPGSSGDQARNLILKCPQQPKLQLPLSRINDGVCDCCDGVDEHVTQCPDVCEEMLAEERSKQQKLKDAFRIGFEKRQSDIKEFESIRERTLTLIAQKNAELEEVQKQQKDAETEIRQAKFRYMRERLDAVKSVQSQIAALVNPLTAEELKAFIIQACQLSGEMGSQKESTCVALRLAGMDLGLVWEKENIERGTASLRKALDEENGPLLIADLMIADSRSEELDWESSKPKSEFRKSSRRHDYENEDDDYESFDDDDYFEPDDEDTFDSKREPTSKDNGNQSSDADVQLEIRKSGLSKSRVVFVDHADKMIQKIDDLTIEQEEADEEEGDEDDKPPSFDPVAFKMVQNTLRKRKENIETGFKYAASAVTLLRALDSEFEKDAENYRRTLADLAVGTVFHGSIRAQDVWQLLVMNVAEFGYEDSTVEDVCSSDGENGESCLPSTSSSLENHIQHVCPPRLIESRDVPFPPQILLTAAKLLCEEWSKNPPSSACPSSIDIEAPGSIPDGYCGYVEVHPRKDGDELSASFSPISSMSPSSDLSALEDKLKSIETIQRDVEKELNKLHDDIGGKEQDKFGQDGELHSLRNLCPSVEAGKYEYEVCLFGKATQRDRGASHGTDLGKWKGMSVDPETGERTMKWQGGASCWNGPQRSATVHVTCGQETKLLSAEEPDTCRYVLEMESHVACDGTFKQRNDL